MQGREGYRLYQCNDEMSQQNHGPRIGLMREPFDPGGTLIRTSNLGAGLPHELLLLPIPSKSSRSKSAPTEKPMTYGMFGERARDRPRESAV